MTTMQFNILVSKLDQIEQRLDQHSAILAQHGKILDGIKVAMLRTA